MVVIRLARSGAKKRPFYHVVVSDSRSKRDGRHIERLGFSNPIARGGEGEIRLDRKRIEYWQAQGARTSEAVQRLLRTESRLAAKQQQDAKQAEKSKFKPAQRKASSKPPVTTEAEAPAAQADTQSADSE